MKERFIFKYKKEKILYNVALIFPDSYSIGMSNLGFQWVYHLLQLMPWINCERAFYSKGRIKTIETSRPLNEFDILVFSISFENNLINIIKMLRNSGIEILREKRTSPLIFIGGIATSIIYSYLKELADLIFFGDAEITLSPFLEKLKFCRSKKEILDSAIGIDGVYIPGQIGDGTSLPYISKGLKSVPFSVIISDEMEFKDTGLILVSEGCLHRCNFCFVSNIFKCYRYFSVDEILRVATLFLPFTKRIGLIAATLTDHPNFRELVVELNKIGFSLSFSSFRVESIPDDFLKTIVENENKTITVAPETVSFKLKRLINKNIPNDIILNKIEQAASYGIKRIKLYFIIGLPSETMDDIEEMVNFIGRVREISSKYSKKFGYLPEIIVDINPFIPKPHTPMFNFEMEDISNLRKKILFIKKKVRNFGRIFVSGESPKSAYLQFMLGKNRLSFDELLLLSEE